MTPCPRGPLRRTIFLAVFLLGMFSPSAHADTITFSYVGVGSGTFDGTGFTDQDFDVTFVGDTEDVCRPCFPNAARLSITTATVFVAGFDLGHITTNQAIYVNRLGGPNPDDVWQLYTDPRTNGGRIFLSLSGDLRDWDMASPIAPQFFFLFGPRDLVFQTTEGVVLFDSAVGTVTVNVAEAFIPVTLDIKPGSDPHSINLKSKGLIPVAILSDADFSAITEIDVSTLRFGPEGAEPEDGASAAHKGHVDDVNGDGYLDAVIHFPTQNTGIGPDDEIACVTGTTSGGAAIEGCDSIQITPGSAKGKGN